MRNALDAVEIGRNSLRVDDLVPVHAISLGGVHGCLRLIPNSDAEHIEIVTDVLVIDLLDVRDLPLARAAPRCPEVNEDVLALTYIVGKLNAVDVEVGEHRPLGGCLFCIDSFLHL